MELTCAGDGRRASRLALLAVGWGLALIVAALLVPEYGSQTLVDENGAGVLVPVAIPALISAATWVALRLKCSHSSRVAGFAAWLLIALLCAFCLLAILSIGIFVIPAAALLVRAAMLTPGTAPAQ